MLDNTLTEPSKFMTKNWAEISNDLCGTYNINNQIKFKTMMLKSNLCGYSDPYILVSGTITITGEGGDDAKSADKRDKGVTFKNWTPFTDYLSEINNAQVDNAKYLDAVIPMYNLIQYSNNYSKASGDFPN